MINKILLIFGLFLGCPVVAKVQTPKYSLRNCDTGNPQDVMVAVGVWCVDKYEASVWSDADGSGKSYFTDSTTSSDLNPYYPTGEAHLPPDCKRTGAGCKQYAVSKPHVIPARGVTWYQASRFCINSGKTLIPDSVWQMAVIGTVDPGKETGTGGLKGGSKSDGPSARCNIDTETKKWKTWLKDDSGVRPTSRAGKTSGGSASCISDFGIEDMIGNLWEWTDLNGAQAGQTISGFNIKGALPGGSFATQDGTWNVNGSASGCDGEDQVQGYCDWKKGSPAAAFRGGRWHNNLYAGAGALNLHHAGSRSGWGLGFRCARPR